MEKLVYLLWRPPSLEPEAFRQELLGPLREKLLAAGTRGLCLNLVDADVAYALPRRLTRLEPPLDALVSFWLDAAEDRREHEAALRGVCQRLAGYTVAESVPLRNSTHRAPLGQRTPGTQLVGLLERPEHLDAAEWLRRWYDEHRPVALETQCTYLYVRNLVVRALTEDAPPWAGIVLEGFPADAVMDPMKWYVAEGSRERLERNLARMLESCRRFLELERVESHPMSEYVIQEQP